MNAPETAFLEGLSTLILGYMISNLMTRAGVSDDRLFEKFRVKIAALIQNHAADAEKFPWASRLIDPEL
jgi:hypothetical protein